MNYKNLKNVSLLNILQKINGLGYVTIRKYFSEYNYSSLLERISSEPIIIGVKGKQIVIDNDILNEDIIEKENKKILSEVEILKNRYNADEQLLNISTFWDNDFPAKLNKYHNAPIILYAYGDYSAFRSNKKFIAIIGSRKSKILDKIQKQADKIAKNDYNLITGYAPGADFCGITAFANQNKPVIAILGGSIFDYDLLKNNKEINKKIIKNGLFLSETGFLNYKRQGIYLFLRDNIIACLSDELYIMDIENPKSGTIDTFNKALKTDKKIFVFSTNDSGTGIDFLLDKFYEKITIFNDFDMLNNKEDDTRKLKTKKQLKLI